MKVTILIDNLSQSESLIAEHGLAFYLETESNRILFDTGQSAAFLQNAEKLGIDLSQTDYLVLSHGHFDHTGGIKEFLKINSKAFIIVKAESLLSKYHAERYIGMPKGLQLPPDRLMFADSEMTIGTDIFVMGQIPIFRKSDTHFEGFFIENQHSRFPDHFDDELFLVHREDSGLSLFTGCSHHGITNIIETAGKAFNQKVIRTFGGFHLKNSSRDAVLKVGDYLAKREMECLVTCHCTGYDNYTLLKENKIPELKYGYAGNIYYY